MQGTLALLKKTAIRRCFFMGSDQDFCEALFNFALTPQIQHRAFLPKALLTEY